MEKRNINLASASRLPLLGVAAFLLAGLATETVKAEAPCIDDVAGGVCVPIETSETLQTSSATPSESQVLAWNATGDCDVAGGICETKEARAIAASQYARNTAVPDRAPTCDVVAGVCYVDEGSVGQVATAHNSASALE